MPTCCMILWQEKLSGKIFSLFMRVNQQVYKHKGVDIIILPLLIHATTLQNANHLSISAEFMRWFLQDCPLQMFSFYHLSNFGLKWIDTVTFWPPCIGQNFPIRQSLLTSNVAPKLGDISIYFKSLFEKNSYSGDSLLLIFMREFLLSEAQSPKPLDL